MSAKSALLILWAVLCGGGLAIIAPAPAVYADDGGYPYANYAGPGTNAAQFIWTDDKGQWYSNRYRFAYRNCTDYVAWKLEVTNGWYVGVSMGNAKDWRGWAEDPSRGYVVDTIPAKGSVAWWGSHDWNSGFGHVAYVLDVSENGQKVTLGEYNYNLDGSYSSRIVAASSVEAYIHFKDSEAPVAPTDNTVLEVIKKNQRDGTNVVYWAKPSMVFESWWRPGGSVQHSPLVHISQGDIRDIDMHILPDDLHLLYTATTHDVYETWWYPNRGIHTSSPPIVHSGDPIRKILKTVTASGIHQLYVMTDKGVDEYWWRPGGPIGKTRLYTLANPVAMKKFFEPDGRQSLYIADQGYVYEVWWRAGVPGVTVGQIMRISQKDIVDLDLQVDASTNQHHLFVGAKDGGVWEAKWTPGIPGIAYWHIAGGSGVRAIGSYWDGDNYAVYVATAGGVYEYWWPQGASQSRSGTIVSGLMDVREFDRGLSVDGAQAVYTAFGSHIAETYWWGPGKPLYTSVIE